jgi:hypothetical protein
MAAKQLLSIITSTNADNRVNLITAQYGEITVVKEILTIISINSIDAPEISFTDPLISREQRDTQFWLTAQRSQHKRLNVWMQLPSMANPVIVSDCLIFGSNPTYAEDILARVTGIGELRMEEGTVLSVSISATNSGLLAATVDKLTVIGQYDTYS